ncbi:iron ABC transporter permease [Aggregatilineales bacterium SYSU G02658]
MSLRLSSLFNRTLLIVAGIALLLLGMLVVYPSLVLLWNSFQVGGQLSLNNFNELTNPRVLTALRNSLYVSVWGALGGTTLGVFLAWILTRTDVPFKRVLHVLLIVPYLIPPFIGAIAWVYLLGPVGYINQFFRSIAGSPLFVIYGEAGVILVMILYTYPIAYLITRGPMQQMNPALEEAARISGANTWRTLRDITLPLLWPNISASALLIFMSNMSNFGIPAVIGFPRRYFVLTNEIYTMILNYDRPNNLQIAAAMSLSLVVFAVVVMILEHQLRSRRQFTALTGKSEQPRLIHLGAARYAVLAFVVGVILLAVVAPISAIFAVSVTPAPGVLLTLDNATWRHYDEMFNLPKAQRAFTNSLLLAAGAATLVTVLGFLLAYLFERRRIYGRRVMGVLVLLPYAIPGTVVALAMILAFLRPLPIINLTLYNTIWILLIAYVARFLTFGVQSTSAAFEQLDPSLEEAARISGANTLQTFRDVTIPLLRASLIAGWFLAFMPSLTELTLSILLFSVNNETLGQVVFGLHQEGKINVTAAMAMLVVVFVMVVNVAVSAITRNRQTVV